MKKILCSLWAILICSLAYAQIEKGRMYLGGSLQVSQETNDPSISTHYKDVRTSFGISPEWGLLVSDKVALGVGIGYNKTQIRYHNPTLPAERQKININGLSFNVHGRYYTNTPVEKLKFFLQAGVGFGTTNQPQDSIKNRSMYVYASPNFAYFITSKWCLELNFAGINYGRNNPKATSSTTCPPPKSSYFIMNVRSFQPSLGIRYFFK